MNSKLTRASVLVLNRHWMPIDTRCPIDAIGQMATGAVRALRIEDETIAPVSWNEWFRLPARASDASIATPNRMIRIPTVVVTVHYDRMPRKRLKFSFRGIWVRDRGTCQYTGRKLSSGEGNIDHVVPRSRGGPTSWENCVLASRDVNSRKADRLPEEAGLRLINRPAVPQPVPASALICGDEHPDWCHFTVAA